MENKEIGIVETVAEDLERQKVEEEAIKEVPIAKMIVKKTKAWVVDEYNATKTCPDCGKEMHGWAFRQDFAFCPFCGTELSTKK